MVPGEGRPPPEEAIPKVWGAEHASRATCPNELQRKIQILLPAPQKRLAVHNLVFIFSLRTSQRKGGIAQLVERQLCKLDVWGSNPHASTNHQLGPVAQLVRARA